MLTRRRFIAISAALAPSMALSRSPDLHVETGVTLGAKVTLRLRHPDGPRLAALAMAEIHRLEGIFSLYLPGSALSRLNRDGMLPAPPFDLLDCLTLAGSIHRASGGRFDPTIQPLWRAEAQALDTGIPLSDADCRSADGLSTAASMIEVKESIVALCHQFPGTTFESAIPPWKGKPMKLQLLSVLALTLATPALAGDPAKGEADFKKCKACHSITAPDGTEVQKGGKTGPNLWGVVGNPVASSPDFKYGEGILAAKAAGAIWDEAAIATYVADPNAWVKAASGDEAAKSKMTFKLTAGGEDMAAYLATLK